MGIYVATFVAMLAVFGHAVMIYAQKKRPEFIHKVTWCMVLVMGGATLIFQDEIFIKWKPTAVYWALSLFFLGSQWFSQKTIVERMLEDNLKLTDPKIWVRLNTLWALFFIVMGVINILVAYHFDTDTWVNFKLFGSLALTLVFVIAQAFYLAKVGHIKPTESKKEISSP